MTDSDHPDLMDPAVQQCPYELYKALRASAPLYKMPSTGFRLVTNYALAREVIRAPDQYISSVSPMALSDDGIPQEIIDIYETGGWLPLASCSPPTRVAPHAPTQQPRVGTQHILGVFPPPETWPTHLTLIACDLRRSSSLCRRSPTQSICTVRAGGAPRPARTQPFLTTHWCALCITDLAQHRYFDDAKFVEYIDYLQYWKQLPYCLYITFPHCLCFLDLLQSKNFRKALKRVDFKDHIAQQQHWNWRQRAEKQHTPL